jgi:hypothetical protein
VPHRQLCGGEAAPRAPLGAGSIALSGGALPALSMNVCMYACIHTYIHCIHTYMHAWDSCYIKVNVVG